MENRYGQEEAFDIGACYRKLNGSFPDHEPRPVIAVTGNFGDKGCELAKGYYLSIEQAGGVPVVLPPTDNAQVILSALDRVDAIVFSGGGDINPLFLGEQPLPGLGSINSERDAGELLLARLAYDRQIPMLGICRGIQVLAAALGGEVLQDLGTQYPAPEKLLKHSQQAARHVPTHTVSLEEGSLVHKIFGTSRLHVNSFHHQAVSKPGNRLKVSAIAPDGVIEAVESTEYKSVLGVQCPPSISDVCLRFYTLSVGEILLFFAIKSTFSRKSV